MRWSLREHQKEPSRLAHLLYWQELLDPEGSADVVTQSDCSLLSALRYRGSDQESASDAEKMVGCRQLHEVLRTVEAGWGLHAEVRRHKASPYPKRQWDHPAAALVDCECEAQVQDAHFETDYTFTFTKHLRGLGDAWKRVLWSNIPEELRPNAPSQRFRDEVARTASDLAGLMPEVEVIRGEDLTTFLKSTISLVEQRVGIPDPPWFLASALSDQGYTPGSVLQLGDFYVRIIAVRNNRRTRQAGYPPTTLPGMLDALHDLPMEYRLVQRWLPLSLEQADKELNAYQNFYLQQGKSLMSGLLEKLSGSPTRKRNAAADDAAEQVAEARRLLQEGVTPFGYCNTNIMVWDEVYTQLDEKRKVLEQTLRAARFVVETETFHAHEAFLSMVPGNFYHGVRKPLIDGVNVSRMLATTSVSSGVKWVPYLQGGPWIIGTAKGQTPYGLTTHHGDVGDYFLVGPKGCIDAKTFIRFHVFGPDGKRVNHKGGTIETLYRRFNNLPQKTEGPQQTNVDRVFLAPSMNDEGTIELNRIHAVFCTGTQPCFRLTTASGEEIIATADHRFFTGEGYTRLEHLAPGDCVYLHTNRRPPREDARRRNQGRDVFNVKHHPYAPTKMVGGHVYHRIQRARGVYEAHLNGLSVETYVERLNTGTIEGMQFLPPDIHVHHRDENWRNNTIENFVLLDPAAHSRHHALKRNVAQLRFVTYPDTIVSIESIGMRTTYDMEMEGPYHNYVANNIVTHNSGKSALQALLSLQWLQYSAKGRPQVRAFDKGGSLLCATYAVDGVWMDLTPGHCPALQPLRYIDQDDECTWGLEWVGDLLTLEHIDVGHEVRREIWAALRSLATFPPQMRTLSGLCGLVQRQDIRNALTLYTVDGAYGSLLDGDEDPLPQQADWQCFEIDGLLKRPRIVPPVMSVVYHSIRRQLDGRPTLCSYDEVWAVMLHEAILDRMLDDIKTVRRLSGTMAFVTQELFDVHQSRIAQAIINACMTRIYGANPNVLDTEPAKIYTGYGLTDRQREIVAELTPKREYYVTTQAHGHRRFTCNMGPITQAFCGRSRIEEIAAIQEVKAVAREPFAVAWLRHEGLDEAANLLAESFDEKGRADAAMATMVPVSSDACVLG